MSLPLAAAIEVLDGIPIPSDSQALVVAKCRALMHGYDARWKDAPYLVDSVEEVITAGLWNPETNRQSRSFTLAGKKDVNVRYGDRLVLIDHKTTSEDIADVASPYWRQLVVEAQPTHYMLLDWLNGRKVDDAVWDVLRKPQIRPKKLDTKRDIADTLATGAYFGRKLSDWSIGYLRENGSESFEMYGARLAHDCTVNRPEWYFQRRSVPRLDAQISDWANDLWAHSQELLIARREDRWPKNSGACMLYGRPCKFLGICSGYDSPDSDKWTRKTWVHNELPVLDGDGRDVLTMSRIRSFQTCRRKHFYEYELGIERVEEDEAEALYFGNCWHATLEAYFLALKKEQQNDRINGYPVTAAGTTANVNETPVNC